MFADERNRTMYHVSCEAIRQYICVVVSFFLLTGDDLTADRSDSELVLAMPGIIRDQAATEKRVVETRSSQAG